MSTFRPDNPKPKSISKLPTLENKSKCFDELKVILEENEPNGEWYFYDSKFKSVFIKCIFALKEEEFIELKDSQAFKFTNRGYEVYDAESYIDFTIKKNIIYFIIDSMKNNDEINFDGLINKFKSVEQTDLKKLIKNESIKQAVSNFYSSILLCFKTLET